MDRETARMLDEALTARQLIDEIKEQCPDLDSRVILCADYGDYHHTTQALPVGSIKLIDSGRLAESAYSHSHVAVVGTDEDEGEELDIAGDDDTVDVVAINLDY